MSDEEKTIFTRHDFELVSSIGEALKLDDITPQLGLLDVNITGKAFGLPSNWEQLAKESYLFQLFFAVLKMLKYKPVVLEEAYDSRFKLGRGEAQFLKGFGIPFSQMKIPKCPDKKSKVQQGVYSFMRHKYVVEKGFIMSTFKFCKARNANLVTFGDVWGKGHIKEKKIIDFLINCSRSMDFDESELDSYIVTTASIVKEFGLKSNLHKSALFSDTEQLIFDQMLVKAGLLESSNSDEKREPLTGSSSINLFAEKQKRTWISGDPRGLKDRIMERQYSLRTYRTIVRLEIDKRMMAIYSRYENKRDRARARKENVKILINNLEHTPEYSAFGPEKIIHSAYGIHIPSILPYRERLQKYLAEVQSIVDNAKETGAIDIIAHANILIAVDEFAVRFELPKDFEKS